MEASAWASDRVWLSAGRAVCPSGFGGGVLNDEAAGASWVEGSSERKLIKNVQRIFLNKGANKDGQKS